MPAGRPTMYSESLVEKICERIADGESLRRICEDPKMPNRQTVRRWLNEKPQFSAQYARAREEQAEFFADEIIEIADDKSQDILEVGEGGDIRSLTNSAAVQRAKLQVDARKWKASQMAPKKWGQQNIKNEHTGADGGPIVLNLNITSTVKPDADS